MAGYALTKICTKCRIEKAMGEYHSKANAKDGKVSVCKPCKKEVAAEYLRNNREKEYLRKRKWNGVNKDIISVKKKAKRDAVQDNLRRSAHKKAFPHLCRANGARRRAVKQRSTVSFANIDKVQELYKQAVYLSKTTGVAHHVDHIVPLRSKVVCGLHWEGNLQILTAEENLKKGNRVWPGMP